MSYHGPKKSGDRGELLPGPHRERKAISALLTGEKRGSSTIIYDAARNEQVAEYIVGWQGQSEGGELQKDGRLIRYHCTLLYASYSRNSLYATSVCTYVCACSQILHYS